LKGSEPDGKSAPTQQLDGLGLTDIVLCAPGFESDDDGQEFSLQELAAQHAERERIV
jgi:hypothetical protein